VSASPKPEIAVRLLLVKDTLQGRAILHIEGDPAREHTIAGKESLVRARAAELFPGIEITEHAL
jgi:hypothetical protein